MCIVHIVMGACVDENPNRKRRQTGERSGAEHCGRSVCRKYVFPRRAQYYDNIIINIIIILHYYCEYRIMNRGGSVGVIRGAGTRYRTGRTTRNRVRVRPTDERTWKECVCVRERVTEMEVCGRTDRQMDRRKVARRRRSPVYYITCTHVHVDLYIIYICKTPGRLNTAAPCHCNNNNLYK